MYPNNTEVRWDDFDRVYDEIMAGMDDYLGHVFEDVCSEFVSKEYHDVGTWWGIDPSTNTMEDIDIAAKGRGIMLLCECKYERIPVGTDVLGTLERRSVLVKSGLPKRLSVFSRSGFTEGAEKMAEEKGIGLYSLDDVSEPH